MHPQDFALVGLRMIAVYAGINSVTGIVGLGSTLADFAGHSGIANAFLTLLMIFLVQLLPAALAILVWVLAPRLSGLAARERKAEESSTSLSVLDLTRGGLIIVGVFVFLGQLPQLATQLIWFVDETVPTSWPYLISSLLSCLLAIGVVLGSDRIAGLVERFRYAGRAQ